MVGAVSLKQQPVAIMVATILAVMAVIPAAGIPQMTITGEDDAASAAATLSAINTDGAILRVGGSGPGNYTTIQAAIDNASDGDTVYVYNGTYQETIRVQPSIQLAGEDRNGTVIDGAGSGTVVAIHGDHVSMHYFTVTGGAIDGGSAAVEITADHVTFAHNVVRDSNRHAIILESASHCTLSRTVITGTSYHGIHIINASRNNSISYNTITSGMAGVYVGSPHPQTISSNGISNCSKGIYLEESQGNVVIHNHITGSQEGIFCSYAPGNAIQRNNFIANIRHARFATFLHPGFLTPNRWSHNYWDDWIGVGGKAIPGAIYVRAPALIGIFIPWVNVDWHPAAEPYEHPTE